jgi:hypothetical protein
MVRNSPATIALAAIQIACAAIVFFFLGLIQLVTVVFGGTGNVEPGLVLVLLKSGLYMVAGLSLLRRERFALILAYIAAVVAITDGVVATVRNSFSNATMAFLVFHVIYLVWFIYIRKSWLQEANASSQASRRAASLESLGDSWPKSG